MQQWNSNPNPKPNPKPCPKPKPNPNPKPNPKPNPNPNRLTVDLKIGWYLANREREKRSAQKESTRDVIVDAIPPQYIQITINIRHNHPCDTPMEGHSLTTIA